MLKQIPCSFVVSSQYAAVRLDAALVQIFPEFGLRARRRLWDWCLVSVNGIPRSAGYRVSVGDNVSISHSKQKLLHFNSSLDADSSVSLEQSVQIIATAGDIIAFSKPSGLHTANIQGSGESSCERYIQKNWIELWGKWQAEKGNGRIFPPYPYLVTRLDKETSGILLAANGDSIPLFRSWERNNQIVKKYFALICGSLQYSLRIRIALNVNNKRQSKPMLQQVDDTRSTLVMPLVVFQNGSETYSLVRATIHRGARHQIRAHLAYAGYPLWGDHVYTEAVEAIDGQQKILFSQYIEQDSNASTSFEAVEVDFFDSLKEEIKVQNFFLHHGEVSLAGEKTRLLPEWGWLTQFCTFS